VISFPCPDCSGAIQHDSSLAGCTVACPHCGGSLLMPPAACSLDADIGIDPQAGVLDRAAGILARHQRRRSRVPGLWTALLICVILLAVYLAAWLIVRGIADPGGKKSADDRRWGASAEAYETAQRLVAQHLVSPTSARFPSFCEATITRDDTYRWHVSTYLDAQNRFGVMIRGQWIAVVQKQEDGTWSLDSLSIDGRPIVE